MKPRILAVDDEPDALELISTNLSSAGFIVVTAEDGEEALRKARANPPDLILLDLMLPEIDGLELCKLLRRDDITRDIPIIILTAKSSELDRVLGLELGADDYVTKPFSPRELVLRVKGMLRRRQTVEPESDHISIGPITVDVPRHVVSINDKPVELTVTEFKLLTNLIQKRGRVVSREQLLRDVWEYDAVIDSRTVDTHVGRLRDKLGTVSRYLETVRGVGYRFVEDSMK